MLRLLPERLSAGLFHGNFWLRGRRPEISHSISSAATVGEQSLLFGLETILDERASLLQKGSRLALTVSDCVGRIITIPWQEKLHSQSELNAYARICFEKQGVVVGDDWAIRTTFLRFRSTGIAYALSNEWLCNLEKITRKRGLTLTSVMPVSAAAFYNQSRNRSSGQTLWLLREDSRATALVYDNAGVRGYEMEPATATGLDCRVRLARKISGLHNNILSVHDWSSAPTDTAIPGKWAADSFPSANVQHVQRNFWG